MRVLWYIQKRVTAAKQIANNNVCAQRPYRKVALRQFLDLANKLLTLCRWMYKSVQRRVGHLRVALGAMHEAMQCDQSFTIRRALITIFADQFGRGRKLEQHGRSPVMITLLSCFGRGTLSWRYCPQGEPYVLAAKVGFLKITLDLNLGKGCRMCR